MTSTLSILNNVTTPLKRCINEVIILIPLAETNVVNLNGTIHNIQNGLIINNCDLYQYLNINELIELRIPLTLFIEREPSLANCYFDFDSLNNPNILHSILTRYLCIHYSNTTISTGDIGSIISLLLKEAKCTLPHQYLPQFTAKHKLLNDILTYINQHLNNDIHTKTVAQNFFISQSYISILFSNIIHMHFKNYVISLKIALSLYDLLSPNQIIQSVARTYSFMNLSTFTKHFKTYLSVPPKVYIHQFNSQMSICQSSLSINSITKDYYKLITHNQQKTTTPLPYTLNLNSSEHTKVLPIPMTFITIKDIAMLSKLIHIQDAYFNLTHFTKPNIYIEQLKSSDLTPFNVKLILAILPKLKSKDCCLVLPIYSLEFYQLVERQLLNIIANDCTYYSYYQAIKLVIHNDGLSDTQHEDLKQLIRHRYPNISLGVKLDNYINHPQSNFASITNLVRDLNVDFFIINQNFSTLIYKLTHTTHNTNDCEALQSFIKDLKEYAKLLIFTRISVNDINSYFNSYTEMTTVKIAHFLIELTQQIGGFGFPFLLEDNDDIAILNTSTSGLSLVHIYSMLLPFMGQKIQFHDLGLLMTKDNTSELLFYDGANTMNYSLQHLITIKHQFTRRFQVYNRVLKASTNQFTKSLSNTPSIDTLKTDKILLLNFNKVNSPIDYVKIHEPNATLDLLLAKGTIHYLKLQL